MKRTALVTGASRGIGRSIALELGAAGMNVVVNYFDGKHGAEELCDQIGGLGAQALAVKADVRDSAEIDALVAQAEQAFGGVDVLVVNATGPQPMLSIEEQTWESYLDQLEFFVKSPLLLVKRVLPRMRAEKNGPRQPLRAAVAKCSGRSTSPPWARS